MLLSRKAARGTHVCFGHEHDHVEIGAWHLHLAHDYVLLLRSRRANPED
jgi:hypothetical protein